MPFRLGPGAFRLLLALLVVLSHLSAFGIGRPAVMMFFMLSGYWVPRMYEQKYRPMAPVWLFYLSRLLRVWLPFAIAFIAVYALYALTAAPKPPEVLSGLGLLGLATSQQDVLGTAWSLDIEVQFYLAVPLIWVLLRICMDRQRLPLAIGATLALCGLGWYLQLGYGVWTVLSYLPPFVAGTLIWLLKPRVTPPMVRTSLLMFTLAGVVVLASPGLRPLLVHHDAPPFALDWFGMAWVLMLMPFVIWNLGQKSSARDMHFGNFSYALYITHWPVIAWLQPLLAPVSLADKLLFLAVIAVVSIGFYLAVDRPCEGLRRRLIFRLSRQAVTG